MFHVIGFGNVNNNFLDQVRKFGTKEGLFRYSTQSVELQNNFNDKNNIDYYDLKEEL